MGQIVSIFNHVGAEKLLIGIAALLACLLISRGLLHLFDRVIGRMNRIMDSSLRTLIRAILRFVLVFLSVAFSANLVGIPITSLVALFSVVGLAVSLAVQGVLANFAGGIIILVSKPFREGDYIETDSVAGTVERIGYLHTQMRTLDGKKIYIPNDHLYTSRLVNDTSFGKRRLDLPLSASYRNTPEEVRKACLAAISDIREVVSEPAPAVVLTEYADSAIRYEIQVWITCRDFQEYRDTRYRLNEALYRAFRENGVEMTYPHLNIHMN